MPGKEQAAYRMTQSSDPLARYRKKRDFRATPEPRGRRRKKAGGRFVIQKHDATSLHYDFRLEVGGVLKSWAVPKGPSTDPRVKRLAMPTEDHPVDYVDFEGVIPAGEYGAGAVIVWDAGTYENRTRDEDGEAVPLDTGLEQGHVKIRLDGKKIRGGYALTRTGKGKGARWLLVKVRDEHADARRNPVSTEPESVRSGRTIEEVAAEEGAEEAEE
jgi:DNA ligase D-like protein (predicted 3'-phosphoesterase)